MTQGPLYSTDYAFSELARAALRPRGRARKCVFPPLPCTLSKS